MKISKYTVYIIGFFVIVSFFGFDFSSVIVGLSAFSIAISFATSTIIQNLVSGILVQADKAFKIGDEIKVQNFEGKVVKISIRTTVLETSEGHTIFIPNSIFINNAVIRKNKENQNTSN
ncbi:MAG: mechanosensitive ion channel [Candidatus Bathyarchaeia archaeon]